MDPDLKFRNQQHDGRNAIVGAAIAALVVVPIVSFAGDYAPALIITCTFVGLYFVLRKRP
jgi:hypothetical protein